MDVMIDAGVGIGIGESIGTLVEGLSLKFEGFAEHSDAASLA